MSGDKPPFYLGGIASVVACFVSTPGDLVKVHLQTSRGQMKSILTAIREIIASKGITGMYTGNTAQMLRQSTYSTARIGIYEAIISKIRASRGPDSPLRMHELIAASSIGGFIGGCIGNPCDVALVRMQTDLAHPPEVRKNYKHVFDALFRIARNEGFMTLYSGLVPNLGVSVVMTVSQIASYDFFKQIVLKYTNLKDSSVTTHFASSALASITAATAVSPIDVAKTRIMNSKNNEYKNLFDALTKIPRQEGIKALYKGWTPSLFRLAPHTIVMFLVLEQLKIFYFKYQNASRSKPIIIPAIN
ncbi:Mitochondrial dicarboxylate carrier [Smittium culicis]|uniref:Mitochondrial dicarboxylate carrier n=1 Tax=Smittium culicis TaxID=133412 RepID=A0A1R1YNM5_9FUNG|nr:Mitochondrial dicarboxylate carrier [Smittium culicis]